MLHHEFIARANELGSRGQAFYFVVDFEKSHPLIFEQLSPQFAMSIEKGQNKSRTRPLFSYIAPGFKTYEAKFNEVLAAMKEGKSWLTNLTIKTKLEFEDPTSLRALFDSSTAPARIYLKVNDQHEWLSQSPEVFVTINNNRITTRPMKGTRSLKSPLHLETQALLDDSKEAAEHLTVVDLLRNDLGIVAHKVEVPNYRYVDLIEHPQGSLIATSSEISGILDVGWQSRVGELLMSILPAGSVSGAPKAETCKLIRVVEGEPRGYFTGVAGYFDGVNLWSYVLIRFIEKIGGDYYYRSGGGITIYADARAEYEEALAKIYLA